MIYQGDVAKLCDLKSSITLQVRNTTDILRCVVEHIVRPGVEVPHILNTNIFV